LAAGTLYGALWLYELSNYAVAAVIGGTATISISGLLPTGVAAVNGVESLVPYAKVAQTAICLIFVGALLNSLRAKELLLTKVALISVLGLYVASIQWEFFSLPYTTSAEAHQLLFAVSASVTGVVLLRVFRDHLNILGYPSPDG